MMTRNAKRPAAGKNPDVVHEKPPSKRAKLTADVDVKQELQRFLQRELPAGVESKTVKPSQPSQMVLEKQNGVWVIVQIRTKEGLKLDQFHHPIKVNMQTRPVVTIGQIMNAIKGFVSEKVYSQLQVLERQYLLRTIDRNQLGRQFRLVAGDDALKQAIAEKKQICQTLK